MTTAAPSAVFLSPRPTQRPPAIAAASVTRTSSRARLRSGAGEVAEGGVAAGGVMGVSLVVENMAAMVLPDGSTLDLFGAGGGAAVAAALSTDARVAAGDAADTAVAADGAADAAVAAGAAADPGGAADGAAVGFPIAGFAAQLDQVAVVAARRLDPAIQRLQAFGHGHRHPQALGDVLGHQIAAMPGPSSGGIAVAATLGILADFDLPGMKPTEVDRDGGRPDPAAMPELAGHRAGEPDDAVALATAGHDDRRRDAALIDQRLQAVGASSGGDDAPARGHEATDGSGTEA